MQLNKKSWSHCDLLSQFVCLLGGGEGVSRSGALKVANLQQCMGTAEGSSMWLERSGSIAGSGQSDRGRGMEDQWQGEEHTGSFPVPQEGQGG